MARPELGMKRQCMSCGAKFYDLDRDPAICPKCGTVYQAVATSRVAAPALAARSTDEDEDTDDKGPEMVSLDEVEAAEDDADTSTDDDSSDDADSGDSDDDTFLEEEDSGDDDVSDLIDGDIENDEES
ncbi:TIGR02300 family protein [Methylobacterium durans]|uniref:TIGR02300 family protein n=1 Tax=Methylobacterium durans TaxID=2202825 RepID=A0A2U8W7S0_9HYPH|nr:TIGR02300 family protein [Methylobacterium durans]AWN42153.1 TIGR02300 family protein [Methylobacterium durans]MEA1831841.1 TIGR02300 family protein [Methylobacterium durans]